MTDIASSTQEQQVSQVPAGLRATEDAKRTSIGPDKSPDSETASSGAEKRISSDDIKDLEEAKPIVNAIPVKPQVPQKGSYNKTYPYFLVINATLGSLFFGYVMSAFNPVNDFVSTYAFGETLPKIVLNFMTSFVPLGAAVGAVIAGKIAALIGRRTSMIMLDCLSILGTVLTVLPNQYCLLIGRLLQGYCVGANSSVIPLYIKEVAPSEIAGTLGTFNQLFVSSGVLLAPIIGLGMPTGLKIDPSNEYFRVVLGVAGIPPIVRLILSFTLFTSETPKYLVAKNKETEALKLLTKIYTPTRAQDELTLLKSENETAAKNGKISLREVFSAKYRMRLVVGIMMSIFQQFSGINAIIFFSNQIFSQGADPNSQMPTVYTIIMDIIQVLTNLVSGMIVERFGRRLLSLFGMAFVTVLIGAFGIVCLFVSDSPGLKFFIWGYMIGFGLSVGPLPWVIISDVLPDVAIGFAVLANWISAFVIGIGFPPVKESLGIAWGFIIFGLISVAGTLFVLFFVKETKGKNEAEIAALYGPKVKA